MERLPNIRPGEILQEEFLVPLNNPISFGKGDKDTSNTYLGNNKRQSKDHCRYSFEIKPVFWKYSKILAWATG